MGGSERNTRGGWVAGVGVVLLSAGLLGLVPAFGSATSMATGSAGSVGTALPPPLKGSSGKAVYVSTKGSDRNPGTLEKPLRTIQRAIDRARPGQRILVRGGLYEESLVFDESGTSDAPISLSRYRGERAVIRPPADDEDTYGLRITGSYIRVKGFVIEGATGESSANAYANDADHIELRGNVIRNGQDQGIFADKHSSYVHIVGNVVYRNGAGLEGQHQSHGMYLQGHDYLVANNVVFDHPHGFGIHVYPENEDTIVTNNTVAYSGLSGILFGGDDVSDITIRNNISAYNARYGIAQDADGASDSRVDTNILFANGWGSMQPDIEGTDVSGGNTTAPPRFVSGRNRDFHITRRSPAVDRAVAEYSLRADRDGVQRPQGRAPDIGAFEWSRK